MICSYLIGDPDDQVDITCAILLEEEHCFMTIAYTNGLICRYTLRSSSAGMKGNVELNRRWKSTHSAPVLVMKYSCNGQLLATGSADFNVKAGFSVSFCLLAV